jgi:hypothetical protein
MEFGICLQGIIPLRREPDHRSEMVSQILFGELYRVLETSQQWLKVQLVYDDYEGWITPVSHSELEEAEFLRLFDAETPCSLDLVQLIQNENRKSVFPIVAGSSLPGIEEFRFTIKDQVYVFDGQVSDPSELEDVESPQDISDLKQAMMHDAMLYLHAPYLWGGRSPFGIDCSGLTQAVYKTKKVKLQRDAKQQAMQGEVVSLLDEALPGDLAFFDDAEGNINHVGLLIDRTRILHCSGQVRIDTIDHEGIYHEQLHQYTHKLRIIKRII